MKAVVAAFNQEKALVEAFSLITNLRMDLFEALDPTATKLIPVPTFEWNGFIVIYHLSENHSVILKKLLK